MSLQARAERRRSVFKAIGAWWREHAASRGAEAEFSQIGPAEVERMAYDLGVSAHELRDFAASGLQASGEVLRMMAALGMTPETIEKAQPAVYRDILRTCAMCEDKKRCRNDLGAGRAAAHFSEYCLNADTLAALRAVHAVRS